MTTENGQLSYLRKLAEKLSKRDQELWNRDRLVQLVFNNCPTDLVIYAVDSKLVFTLSTGKGLEHLGVKEGEVVGTSLYDYFQTQDKEYPPIKYHLLALSGTTSTYDFEWEGRIWHTHCAPLCDSEGNITGATGCGFDITCYIEQQQKIQELEKILKCKKTCSEDKMVKIKEIV
jgi:PAS domain-containing protein